MTPARSPTSSATSATGGGRIDGGVEPGAVAERRRHQAADVEHAHDVAVLLHPVLVAHRSSHARRGAPVDLADVVVGQVVADRLEVGAEPERPRVSRPGRGSGPAGPRARAATPPAGRGTRALRPARRPAGTRPSPSGPRTRRRAREWWRPRRPARTRASRWRSASAGSTATSGTSGCRSRRVPAATGSASSGRRRHASAGRQVPVHDRPPPARARRRRRQRRPRRASKATAGPASAASAHAPNSRGTGRGAHRAARPGRGRPGRHAGGPGPAVVHPASAGRARRQVPPAPRRRAGSARARLPDAAADGDAAPGAPSRRRRPE